MKGMYLSQFIKELKDELNSRGDLPVCLGNNECFANGEYELSQDLQGEDVLIINYDIIDD